MPTVANEPAAVPMTSDTEDAMGAVVEAAEAETRARMGSQARMATRRNQSPAARWLCGELIFDLLLSTSSNPFIVHSS